MRKRIISQATTGIITPHEDWLDLENSALAELTSEDVAHPIESALTPGVGSGWRASEPGQQTVRPLFDKPLRIKHVHLVFHELSSSAHMSSSCDGLPTAVDCAGKLCASNTTLPLRIILARLKTMK